jgi:hypothetical protein
MIASAVLTLMAMAVNAQDAGNPWHLTASENGVEVAFYNTEAITGMEVTAQTVTVALANGKTFPHPVATTTFGFDPRAEGTGTANENIVPPEWKAYYSNGSLHFSEAVSGIAVYSLTGALAAKFTGNHTDVPVNLAPGMYVIQAGNGSAKLPVVSNSATGTSAQPTLKTKSPTAATPTAATPRAGTGTKIYWTIKAGDNTVSVEIPDVVSFRFTADNSIIFTLKDGNTIELTDYQGIEFTLEPAPPTTSSQWDMEKTLKFGGASYGIFSRKVTSLNLSSVYFSVVHNQGVILFENDNHKEIKYAIETIHSNAWSRYADCKRIITFWDIINTEGESFSFFGAGLSFIDSKEIGFIRFDTGTGIFRGISSLGGITTTTIPSNISLNADGSLTVTGAGVSHTFTGW